MTPDMLLELSRVRAARARRSGARSGDRTMKRCARCEKKLRAGSTRRVLDITDAGIVPVLVCSGCARKAIPLMPPKPATVAPLCSCKHGLATTCDGCVEALMRTVRELTAANVILRQGGKS